MKKLKRGDRVRWASQANGGYTIKAGRIVEIVPPGKSPSKMSSTSNGRDHESYVVLVDTVTDWTDKPRTLKTPKHYWPRASALEACR
jgi:hypothetical protein